MMEEEQKAREEEKVRSSDKSKNNKTSFLFHALSFLV